MDWKKRVLLAGLTGVLALSGGGCMILGYMATAMPPMPVKAQYTGLKGQSVAIMVWTDRSLRIDFPVIQLDVANAIQLKLIAAQKDKKDDLEGTTFPVEPRSVVRFQRENPEIAVKPITEVAGMIGVSRLIYIEITSFETRPVAELELFRGSITASIKVIEVDANGVGKIGFEEDSVTTVFPKKSPPEGLPGSNDVRMYQGVLTDFTQRVAEKFFTHVPPDETGSGLK